MNEQAEAEIAAGDARTKLIRNLSKLSQPEAAALVEFLAQAETEDQTPARRVLALWVNVPDGSRAELLASLRRVFGAP